MRVFAINGSARMEKGNTAKLLVPFIEGMEEAGAEVELLYARKLDIKPCNGEFQCWYKTPGECYIKDDMQEIYPRLCKSDILVIASPVYMPLPGMMQNFINRLMAIIEPILTTRNGRTRAKFHDFVRIKNIVLVSTCGWWEMDNFDILVRIAEELAENTSVNFAGAVLRPHAYILQEMKDDAKQIFKAAKVAGNQLIKEGKISDRVLKEISRPLITQEEMRKMDNKQYNDVKAGLIDLLLTL